VIKGSAVAKMGNWQIRLTATKGSTLKQVETFMRRALIQCELRKEKGCKSKAAYALGLSRSSLHSMISTLDLGEWYQENWPQKTVQRFKTKGAAEWDAK